MIRLFSYGTLRQPEVQISMFGRVVPTIDDVLPGFRIDSVKITDPTVARSGTDIHSGLDAWVYVAATETSIGQHRRNR